jgi:tetrahydromethanopterin S-methyltransferase subunit B
MTGKFQAFVFGVVVPLVVAPITAILVTVLSKVAGHEAA